MVERRDRLKKLLSVQEKLKALHETRHATFLSQAAEADTEARELVEHFDAGTMSALFPDLYHRRIANAAARRETALDSARQEARSIATATARTNMVERAYGEVRRKDERETGDRDRLEIIERLSGKPDGSGEAS